MIKWGCAAYVLESWCNLLVCSSIVLLTWQQEKQKLSLQPSDEISINLSEATVKRNDEREGSKITHTCTQLKCRGDARGEAQSSGDRKRRLWRLFSSDSRRFLPGSRLFRPSGAVIGLLLSLLCLLFLRAAGCGMDGIGGPTSSAVERAQVKGSRSIYHWNTTSDVIV